MSDDENAVQQDRHGLGCQLPKTLIGKSRRPKMSNIVGMAVVPANIQKGTVRSHRERRPKVDATAANNTNRGERDRQE
jgi:hypothetical protein